MPPFVLNMPHKARSPNKKLSFQGDYWNPIVHYLGTQFLGSFVGFFEISSFLDNTNLFFSFSGFRRPFLALSRAFAIFFFCVLVE